jgi:two-component system nitrogen regulation sensor histidine kinase NtrY
MSMTHATLLPHYSPAPLPSLVAWARRNQLARKLTFVLTIAAMVSGLATYFAITQSDSPFGPDPEVVMGLLLVDLILLLVLGVLISRRVIGLWLAARRGGAGSRLQTRIVLLFSLVSVIPSIIIATFSALFFNYGVQSWFDERVTTALNGSVSVAEAYLLEHEKLLRADAVAMRGDLDRSSNLLFTNSPQDKKLFENVVATQATIRSLAEAVVFWYNPHATNSPLDYRIMAQGLLSFSITFDLPSPDVLTRASDDDPVILTSEHNDRVRALIKLKDVPNTYLLVGRFVDEQVLDYMERTKGAASEYAELKGKISDLQIKFSVIFITVALLLLLLSVWLGMLFAGMFAGPIGKMIALTNHVKEGDFTVRVDEGPENDEIATLGRALNRMTAQLDRQRQALVDANHQIDARRRFSEAVLAGVSAGIIALDSQKKVTLYNRAAKEFLGIHNNDTLGKSVEELLPGISTLLEEANASKERFIQSEIALQLDKRALTLLVRVTAERSYDVVDGYVVTFDDISPLLSAQRSAAWAGVARRIAHEIKNPLTPIHLAAERLRKKYAAEITSDPETFSRYVETIIRHVDDIGRMVNEFASFARMPAPQCEETDIRGLVQDIIFSQRCANESVEYDVAVSESPMLCWCDPTQIRQVIINLCKNAVESLLQDEKEHPVIHVILTQEAKHAVITIHDNGKGFPENLLDRLTEPYVTTRAKGTGLGLAIVKKIVEDHQGELQLYNAASGGAVARILLPLL